MSARPSLPPRTRIFVFGSNRAGRHGRGAALYARQHHGAVTGVGEGLAGASYALPTKDEHLNTLPLIEIDAGIARFLSVASERADLEFHVTPIGCGLAGYTRREIAALFFEHAIPANVLFTREWFQR